MTDDSNALADELDARLADADAALADSYQGDRGRRQPVHTVYVPADRFDSATVSSWADEARHALAANGGSVAEFAEALGLPPGIAAEVFDRIGRKLAGEAIEDLRIDFEDGYGVRPDEDEDAAAVAAATDLAASIASGSAAPFHGIRVKSFEAPTRRRGVRTLQLFVATLAEEGGLTESDFAPHVRDGFVITLPKVTSVEQVDAFVFALGRVEESCSLEPGTLHFEIQVETPQAILGADGTALIARMIHAGGERVTGLHYGTYDYSASLGIAAEYQSLEHPVADHAKGVMQVAAAGTGVFVSDGSTNVLPAGDREVVRAAWRLHARLVRRSLERGIYQGWDLHPAHLPSRYGATYSFFREGLPRAAERLRAYVHGGQSGFLDEPATAAAMAGFLLRGLECGAVDAAELDNLVGVDPAALAILAKRRPRH
jgi:citrate lyase beta subunit